MTRLRVGVARVPQRRSGRQVDARAEIARLADRLPDHPGVLVIRHLSVAPGAEAEGRDRVESLRRSARRPANETVPADAAAVWFADEVELLLCLTDDLARGRVREHWWWRDRLGRDSGSAADVLERVWLSDARWVPAAVAGLHRIAPSRAAAAVALLPPAAAARVRLAVLAEHGVAPVVAAAGPPVGSSVAARIAEAPPPLPAPSPGRPAALAVAPQVATGPHPVDAAVARLHPEARALLETALLLEAPAPSAPPALDLRLPGDPPAAAYDDRVPAAPQLVPDLLEPLTPSIPVPSVRPVVTPSPTPVALADERPDGPGTTPGEVVPIRSRRAKPGGPVPGSRSDDGEPPPWQHHPWQASGPAVPTAFASLLYAVNLLPLLDRTPARPGTGWAVVEALGRWLLRDLPPARRRELLRDPLLPLLATLDGREPEVPSPVRLGAATRPVRGWLDRHDVRPETFLQPGRVLVSRTHVDVLLALDQADVRIRALGLDQDPGWVPALGRIVLFHFEDNP